MTWSRFDDGYDEHEKIEDAWHTDRATIGLHVMATTACNRWLSDGVIRPRWLNAKLPDRKERARVLAAMVEHSLFDVILAGATRELVDSDGNPIAVGPFAEDRYVVHDFLDRHDSSVQIKARRLAEAERKRLGRRKDSGRSPAGVRPDSAGTPGGQAAESGRSPLTRGRAGARPHPDPTRPDPASPPSPLKGEWAGPPVRPSAGRRRDLERYEHELEAYAAWLLPDEPNASGLVRVALSHLHGRKGTPSNDDVRGAVPPTQTVKGAAA